MARTRKGKVLIVGPTETRIAEINLDDSQAFNRAVNGSISSLTLPFELREHGLYGFCDDDGLRRPEQRPNRFSTHLGHADLRGPIVLFGSNAEGEEQPLTDPQTDFLNAYFTAPPTEHAVAAAKEELAWFKRTGGMEIHSFDNMDDFIEAITRKDP